MLQLNEKKSGRIGGASGDAKFRVVLDSTSFAELNDPAAKRLALEIAAKNGFAKAGLCEQPFVGAVDEQTDEFIEVLNGPPPKRYRGEFTIASGR